MKGNGVFVRVLVRVLLKGNGVFVRVLVSFLTRETLQGTLKPKH